MVRYDISTEAKRQQPKYTRLLAAIIASIGLIGVMAAPALAAKPAPNLAGAQKIDWNLSAAVMPVLPYGSIDIPGSDTASKLIVNQPNGNNQAAITGVMKGLKPNTAYTVYISNGYTEYTPRSLQSSFVWTVLGTYKHDITITNQNPDGTFSGTGKYPAGAATPLTTETITGSMVGNLMTITTVYAGPYNPGYTVTATGTINNTDGSVTGNSPWAWSLPANTVISASGSTGWTGLFLDQLPFTFTTDEYGAGNWHVNLKRADLPTGESKLSVWINDGGTLLISDTFTITK